MISFEDYWRLHNPMPQYAHMRNFCKKIWGELSQEKQDFIYRNIEEKRKKNLFVDYNPYYAMQKNAYPPAKKTPQTLSFSAYYDRYGTTEPQDGWRQENPTGQKVIYVKP